MGASVPAETLAELSRQPLSPLERLEHRIRSRRHPMLGELPAYWCNYLRGRQGGRLRPLEFARYLQSAWDLPSLSDVPRRAVMLAARRLLPARREG
jgi:hypothetical protein